MEEELMIEKNAATNDDRDYAFLREAGLRYIEELGSKFWTDYNEHDPGITILEALCYAITELGYRTDFSIGDLLTEDDGKISSAQTLYTAKNVFTQSPLTTDDYRKLLTDIVGVHNAWLFVDDFYVDGKRTIPAGEINIYADCKKDALTYDVTPHNIYLSGLFKVLLDLDNDLQLGDLNNGEVQILTPATANFKAGDATLTIILPAWNEVDAALLKADENSASVTSATITQSGNEWMIQFDFSYTASSTPFTSSLHGMADVDLQPSRNITTSDLQDFFNQTSFGNQVISLYLLKIQKSKQIIQNVIKKLNENRNLCEDFVSVATVKDEEIAICCDIDAAPDADMEEVQAKVFFAIEEYLNPSVKFYLLNELLNKGYTPDEIFEGPVLQHGFIDTDELQETQLRSEVYASDIISLIMDIKGVLAVKNFRMTKYGEDGNPVSGETGKPWCMHISLWHKPVFSETKSKIIFYKNRFPFLPGLAEVRDTLKWLRAINSRNKLSGYTDDLPLPKAKHFELDEYTSIQYLFPLTYGIGKAGLPESAGAERKAQAKQLKAYLLFYDQLLADFFAQLKNAKELLSTDTLKQTYFAKLLDNIKDIDPVYKKDASNKNLLKLVLQNQNSSTTANNDWQKLYETNETFIDRRNRFLDHLTARFAESFNEYVLLMYSLNYETQQQTAIQPSEIINSKITFLKDYPQISYERARAFNYFPQNKDFTVDTLKLWDTDNVSGLEKKTSRLTGIKNYARRFLYCSGNTTVVATSGTPVKYEFVLKDIAANQLTSTKKFDTQDEANDAIASFIDLLLSGINFSIKQTGSNWQININDKAGNAIATSNNFSSENDAKKAYQKFIAAIENACDNTGLHLVEHILLRPRNNQFVLAPVCLDANCDFCGEEDPYSFRISVVLPYWPSHFRNMAFRNYFEDNIRREAPAHTIVKVCWVNNASLYAFEKAYKDWLSALAAYAFDNATITGFQKANDALVNILFHLNSEYPAATLHDCDESKDTNTVMLGQTVLGSFKN